FKEISAHFKAKKKLQVSLKYLKEIGGSSLTDKKMNVSRHGTKNRGSVPTSYVPFRNTQIISIATAWAETIGAEAIFVGATEIDGSGYPDCRKKYFTAMRRVINEGTRDETKILLETPLISLNKKEIIKLGSELKTPFHLTWSCYKNNDIACGECDSCYYRLKGFHEAGEYDPVEYMVYPKF
ncbi:MAG: 7-cyano-7-deazaguanine synthase, partial [Fibrobacterota bacterium]